jgi:hypothetical protein
MAKKNGIPDSYYELSEHNSTQMAVMIFIITINIVAVFAFSLPMLEGFFVQFLNGRVFNDGKPVSVSLETIEPQKTTNYLNAWAVDIYLKTPSEARYWFNPLLSLFIPLVFIGFVVSFAISLMLPRNIGFLRQKLEREIASIINKISFARYGFQAGEKEISDIMDDVLDLDMRDIQEHADEWGVTSEDLKVLNDALRWRRGTFLYRFVNINSAFRLYMRNHFTIQYGNAVLGFVYIGAAVLIIIVGLRGLKFIPPTQPSLVLFALGLEFTLLMIYAITLMYTKQEEEGENDKTVNSVASMTQSGDFGNSREVESLLRAFLSSSIKKKK